VIANGTVARDQTLGHPFGQQTSVTCGCRISVWQSGASSSGRRRPSIDMKQGYGISKEYLPTKRIGLGLLVALAIRGLLHGWRFDRTLTSRADSAARFMP
jgi:hypothetical protein